jgi:hypothetical protein
LLASGDLVQHNGLSATIIVTTTAHHYLCIFAKCRTTDVNDLTFGCGRRHPLAEQGWATCKNHRGGTEWIPPPHLD